jgi:hypothetical protein
MPSMDPVPNDVEEMVMHLKSQPLRLEKIISNDMPSMDPVPNDVEEMVMHLKSQPLRLEKNYLSKRLSTAYDWFMLEVNQMLRLKNQSIPNTELSHIA